MGIFKTVAYQDMAALYQPVFNGNEAPELSCRGLNDKYLGVVKERNVQHEKFRISNLTMDMTDNYKIKYEDKQLPASMNLCIGLSGKLEVNFKDRKFRAGLVGNRYHNVYVDEPEYELIIHKLVDVIHIAIDLKYYLDLLDENERWSASLKEKLQKREVVFNPATSLCPRMMMVIAEFFNNPLEGNLRNILFEAKIMEIVAMHLSHVRKMEGIEESCPLKKEDKELFFAIREYLNEKFTEDHSLKGLAKQFGVNDFKLKFGFKQMFNSTIFDYIHNLRMEYARKLLLDSGFAVSEVAFIIGYKNPNHFSTAFKRRFGVNPAGLKNQKSRSF